MRLRVTHLKGTENHKAEELMCLGLRTRESLLPVKMDTGQKSAQSTFQARQGNTEQRNVTRKILRNVKISLLNVS